MAAQTLRFDTPAQASPRRTVPQRSLQRDSAGTTAKRFGSVRRQQQQLTRPDGMTPILAPPDLRKPSTEVGQVLLPLHWELYAAEALKNEDVEGLAHLFHAIETADINTRVRSDKDPLMPVLRFGRYCASIFTQRPYTPQIGDTILDLAHRMKRSTAVKYRIRELGGRSYNFRRIEDHERRQYEHWLAAKREDRRRAGIRGVRILNTTLQAKIASIEAADRACRAATAIAERNHMLRATFETRKIVQARWEWRRTAEESLAFSEQDIGLQVSVMWAGKGGPREARIINYDPKTQFHVVRYASGNVKVYDLRRKRFRVTRPAMSNGRVIGNGRPVDPTSPATDAIERFRRQQEAQLSPERRISRHGPSSTVMQSHKVVGPGPAFSHVFEHVQNSDDDGTQRLEIPLPLSAEEGIETGVVITGSADPGADPPQSPLRRPSVPPPLPILAEKIRQILWLPGTSFEEVVEQAAETLGIVGSSVAAKYDVIAKELELQARIDDIHPVVPEMSSMAKGHTYGLFGPRGSDSPVSSHVAIPRGWNLGRREARAATHQTTFDRTSENGANGRAPPPVPRSGRARSASTMSATQQRATRATQEAQMMKNAQRRSSMPTMAISCAPPPPPPPPPPGTEEGDDDPPTSPVGEPKAEGEGGKGEAEAREIGADAGDSATEKKKADAPGGASVPLTPLTPATPATPASN